MMHGFQSKDRGAWGFDLGWLLVSYLRAPKGLLQHIQFGTQQVDFCPQVIRGWDTGYNREVGEFSGRFRIHNQEAVNPVRQSRDGDGNAQIPPAITWREDYTIQCLIQITHLDPGLVLC